jgi:pimeloyl-ACP methyl ester carboxylesterase
MSADDGGVRPADPVGKFTSAQMLRRPLRVCTIAACSVARGTAMESTWVRKSRNGTSVVFIHGVLSSIETAWRSDGGIFWPRLLCNEPTIDDVGIYLFGYRADAFAGTYSLDDAVRDLREYLRLDGVWSEEQIIFVCHSMGGIVARRFLITRELDLVDTGKRIGLFLVASPSLGSNYANLATALVPFYNVQVDAMKFSQTNTWLNALDTDFVNLRENKRVHLFGRELVEDNFIIAKKWLRRSQVVPPWSGARFFGEPLRIAHSDHLTIAKPETPRALQHRVLVEFVRSAVNNIRESQLSVAPQTEAPPTSESRPNEIGTLPQRAGINPILIEWPLALGGVDQVKKPMPGSTYKEPRRFIVRISIVVGLTCLLALIGAPLGLTWLDDYKLRQAMLEPQGRLELSGLNSWDKIPSAMQQPIAGGLSDYELAVALRDRGVLRLAGSEVQVGAPGSHTQASLYVHTLELSGNSSLVTNGNVVTIVAARIISEGAKVLSFLPQNLTAAAPGASGVSGGEVRIASLTVVVGSMSISLPGQNGAKGQSGNKGEPGAAGARGADSVQGPLDCRRGGSDGEAGKKGGQGLPGKQGGNGGAGGIVYLGRALKKDPNALVGIRIELSGGAPGAGGDGGPGGPGGPGGIGGSGGGLCGGGRQGATGPVGDGGAGGQPGVPGKDGQIKEFDF